MDALSSHWGSISSLLMLFRNLITQLKNIFVVASYFEMALKYVFLKWKSNIGFPGVYEIYFKFGSCYISLFLCLIHVNETDWSYGKYIWLFSYRITNFFYSRWLSAKNCRHSHRMSHFSNLCSYIAMSNCLSNVVTNLENKKSKWIANSYKEFVPS